MYYFVLPGNTSVLILFIYFYIHIILLGEFLKITSKVRSSTTIYRSDGSFDYYYIEVFRLRIQ